jgi:predicted transcriptional regulator
MARTIAHPKADSFTFRLDPAMKAALTRSAAQDRKPPAELMRQLVREHIARRERQAFEAEARRQCLAINAAARDPGSDESKVMDELAAHIDAMAGEWT